jgi:four helix bundle protein
MAAFRFQDLEIWREACRLGDQLDEIAEGLHRNGKHRYAEQLRSAALSVSNNIAEGSGSESTKEFLHFLNIARRSVFENANMVLFLERCSGLEPRLAAQLVEDYRVLSARIAKFRQTLMNS